MRNLAKINGSAIRRFGAGSLILAGILALSLVACNQPVSSGKAGETTYTISKGTVTPEGTGDFDISTASAKEGDGVALTLKNIDPAYEFLSWNCSPATVIPVEVSSGVYGFEMPGSNVVVNLALSPKAAQKFTVTKGTVTPQGAGDFDISPAEAAAGATVTLTLGSISAAYDFGSWNCTPASVIPVKASDSVYTFTMPGQNVTANAAFVLKPLAPAARSVDFAFGRGDAAYSSGQSEYNAPAVVANICDGDPDTQCQLSGDNGVDQKWFAVNLGSVKNIGTVRITWGIIDYDGNNPAEVGQPGSIKNYEIWVGGSSFTGTPDVASINQWTKVLSVNNSGRPFTETLTLPASTSGQWVAVIRQAGSTAANGEWTDWPRLSMLEVYDQGAPTLIGSKGSITIPAPVYHAEAPAIGTDYAPSGLHYTAKLMSINPTPVDGIFTHSQAYTYTVNLVSDDYYRFTSAPPSVNDAKANVTANDGLTMTFTLTFPAIPLGAIEIEAPSPDAPAAALNGNYAVSGSSFTAALTAYGGVLENGNYKGGVAYTFEFTLTATGTFTFTNDVLAITVNGNTGTYQYINDTTAKLTYTFPVLPYPPAPGAKDWVYNISDNPQHIYTNPGANGTNVRTNPFDGNPATFFQSTGADANQAWFAVNMGSAIDLGTIRITWDDPNSPAADGMMHNYNIQININASPSVSGYSDDGWKTVVQVRNERAPTLAESKSLYGVGVVTLPPGTNAQWIRIQRAAGSSTSTNKEWSDWVRIYLLEVYSQGAPTPLAAISDKSITGVPAPVYNETAPVLGTDFAAAGGHFTAKLTSISPALPATGRFDQSIVYTYTILFEASSGYRFTTAAPNVNGAAVIAANFTNNGGYSMEVKQAFAATAAAVPGSLDIVVNAEADFSGFPSDITLYKSGGGMSQLNISLAQYTSAQWYLNGGLDPVSTGGSYTLDAANLQDGPNSLSMIVTVNGNLYSKTIDFMVRQ